MRPCGHSCYCDTRCFDCYCPVLRFGLSRANPDLLGLPSGAIPTFGSVAGLTLISVDRPAVLYAGGLWRSFTHAGSSLFWSCWYLGGGSVCSAWLGAGLRGLESARVDSGVPSLMRALRCSGVAGISVVVRCARRGSVRVCVVWESARVDSGVPSLMRALRCSGVAGISVVVRCARRGSVRVFVVWRVMMAKEAKRASLVVSPETAAQLRNEADSVGAPSVAELLRLAASEQGAVGSAYLDGLAREVDQRRRKVAKRRVSSVPALTTVGTSVDVAPATAGSAAAASDPVSSATATRPAVPAAPAAGSAAKGGAVSAVPATGRPSDPVSSATATRSATPAVPAVG